MGGLILLCGRPATGKTYFAKKIQNSFSVLNKKTVLINEEFLNCSKINAYQDSNAEKRTRSSIRSSVQSLLDKNTIVIVDSLNYIKGFRYELFCIAKSQNLVYCLLYVDTLLEISRKWNMQREDNYPESIFEELTQRMEVPNPKFPWDKPFSHITSISDEDTEKENHSLNEVTQFVLYGKAPKPGLATISPPIISTNFIHQVDLVTQELLNVFLSSQSSAIIGDSIALPKTKKKIFLSRKIQIIEARRLRKQFLKIIGMQKCDLALVNNIFADYLNEQISQ